MQTLKLQEFREIYKQTKPLPFWLRHLILGLLYWLEERYIIHKIDTTITRAIDDYNQVMPDLQPPPPTVVITENPNSSHQLPTLTISSPYSKGFPRIE